MQQSLCKTPFQSSCGVFTKSSCNLVFCKKLIYEGNSVYSVTFCLLCILAQSCLCYFNMIIMFQSSPYTIRKYAGIISVQTIDIIIYFVNRLG